MKANYFKLSKTLASVLWPHIRGACASNRKLAVRLLASHSHSNPRNDPGISVVKPANSAGMHTL